MPEVATSTVVILLAACAGFLFLVFLVLIGIRGQLTRIERLLAVKKETVSPPSPAPAVDFPPGGIFETFLSEDPARKMLSKKEQAAAYRKWRQEKGMNWSNS